MSIQQINLEMCKALGLDAKTTARVEIVLSPTELPTVVVYRHLKPSDVDRLQTVIEQMRLKVVPDVQTPEQP